MSGDNNKNKGKRYNQKLKPYVVLQYLLKYTDEDHVADAQTIVDYLTDLKIPAERRSVYRDIEDINKVLYMLEDDCDIEEAEEAIEDKDCRAVVYDGSKKGFYVRERHFDLIDLRLLAESVYSSKFITKSKEEHLIEGLCEFVSEGQAETIRHESFVVDRVKTLNTVVFNNITTINEAISPALGGKPHTPEKIAFKYRKYNINHLEQLEDRRHGEDYIASPYQLLINEGNYYLFAYDEKKKRIWPYRVDRMRDVRRLGEPREGKEVFAELDIKRYTRRVFSMFSGERETVAIRFINRHLDTVVDRFGIDGVYYRKVDDSHFVVRTEIEVSDQFFAWICGFKKGAKIIDPPRVVDQMKDFVSDIVGRYKE